MVWNDRIFIALLADIPKFLMARLQMPSQCNDVLGSNGGALKKLFVENVRTFQKDSRRKIPLESRVEVGPRTTSKAVQVAI